MRRGEARQAAMRGRHSNRGFPYQGRDAPARKLGLEFGQRESPMHGKRPAPLQLVPGELSRKQYGRHARDFRARGCSAVSAIDAPCFRRPVPDRGSPACRRVAPEEHPTCARDRAVPPSARAAPGPRPAQRRQRTRGRNAESKLERGAELDGQHARIAQRETTRDRGHRTPRPSAFPRPRIASAQLLPSPGLRDQPRRRSAT